MNWETAWLNLKGKLKALYEQQRLYELYELEEADRIKAGHKADAYEHAYLMMLYAEDHEGDVEGYDG